MRAAITIYPGFVEIRVYAPRVGVAAGVKPKRYPGFVEIRVYAPRVGVAAGVKPKRYPRF